MWPVRKADKRVPPSCAVVMKSGNLNFLEPSGPLQACNGTDLPFLICLLTTEFLLGIHFSRIIRSQCYVIHTVCCMLFTFSSSIVNSQLLSRVNAERQPSAFKNHQSFRMWRSLAFSPSWHLTLSFVMRLHHHVASIAIFPHSMTFWYKLHKMMMDLSCVFFPYHISGCAYLTL